VRPNFVVLLFEVVKGALLRREIRLGGAGGLGLERAMHALMPAILIRPSWLNPFWTDTQSDPPN
jgi:hypothetical protein